MSADVDVDVGIELELGGRRGSGWKETRKEKAI